MKAETATRRYKIHLNGKAAPIRASQRSLGVPQRFMFRLALVGGFAVLWPSQPLASAISTLSVVMAAVCLFSAVARREPFRRSGLNRWDEGIAFLGIALLMRLIF